MTPVWRGPGQDQVVRLGLVLASLLALPYFVPLVAPNGMEVYSSAAEAVLVLFAAGAFQYRRSRISSRAERRFFDLGTAALAFWLLEKAIAWLPLWPGRPASILAEDALLAGFYVCFVVGVLLRPDRGDDTVLFGPRTILELAGTLTFVLGLLAYFSWIPFLHNSALLVTEVPGLVLVLALDALLVLRFAWVRRAADKPRWRSIYGWLFLTAFLWFATDFLETLAYAHVLPPMPSGTSLDFVWWLPFFSLVMAASVQEHASGRPAGEEAAPGEGAPEGASDVASEAWGDALVAYAAAFPLLHFLLYATGLLDPATRSARESLSLAVLVVLAGLAVAYQKLLLAENKRLEAIRLRAVQAEHRAYHDALTGLPNRYLLFDRLEIALARARRLGSRLAVLFLDLDRFKVVNDTLGHSVGDRLLHDVAERLSRHVRKGDTLARLGGDEFTVLIETAPHAEDAVKVARNLREVLREPFPLDGRELYVTTSTGISVYPEDGADVGSLLKSADIAMYRAKQQGGDAFHLFQAEMNARAEERLNLEGSLRKALALGQFALQYQPMVETATRRVVGCEALLRWRHPERGLLLPGEFIELAELTGVILEVGPWVLREACREASAWKTEGPPLSVAVNLSARQFLDGSLVQQVESVLAETGLAPPRLELEITESLAMHNAEITAATLQKLRGLGVRLCIDDFGTGYSSLSYLKRFPIDTLKVDRSFVRDLERAPEDATIAATIVAMARILGLRVVAEGVEEEAQLEVLKRIHCDFAQGYLFGAPLWPEGLRSSFPSALVGPR